VILPHVQGNLRFVNCGSATVLANCSYEGSVVRRRKGKSPRRPAGLQNPASHDCDARLYLRDNHNIVMSDFYVEQADNAIYLKATPEDPPSRHSHRSEVSLIHSERSGKEQRAGYPPLWRRIFVGPYHFYQEPNACASSSKVRNRWTFLFGLQLGTERSLIRNWARRQTVGRRQRVLRHGPNADPAMEQMFFQETAPDATLTQLNRALDDLRRLGEADLRLNHPRLRDELNSLPRLSSQWLDCTAIGALDHDFGGARVQRKSSRILTKFKEPSTPPRGRQSTVVKWSEEDSDRPRKHSATAVCSCHSHSPRGLTSRSGDVT